MSQTGILVHPMRAIPSLRLWAGVLIAAVLLASCSSQPPALSDEERALALRIGFTESVLREAKRHAIEPITQLEGTDDNYDPIPVNGIAIAVPGRKAIVALDALKSALAAKGYFPFRYEENFGQRPDRIAIIKTRDQLDALRTMKTNGINCDIEPEQVIARVSDWHRKYGLVIYGAGMDFVEATFVQPPRDMAAFAEEVYKFCPDVVDQGTGSVAALAEEMKRENKLYLWWD
jgi:uncharacterized protein DUF4253